MFRLLPREDKYFDLFNQLAAHISECAGLLQRLFADFENRAAYADKIKEIEHQADIVTHDIIKKLNQTFITPIDREDIHALASGLDDLVDAIEYTSRRVILYRVDSSTEHARRMTDVLVRIVAKLGEGVNSLEKSPDKVLEACSGIHALENEGDAYHHEAIDDLFSNETNAIVIIKMKELYAKMERTIDKCEDVSNILESIVLKNA
jgi:predicted phosphate transport protein (TIGR00153 family)